ncbi:MAG: HAD family hydrolase [Pirellulaceae bacterium]|nr:HAD family hydrolase [Pirellulaceae bacterium]
MSIPSSNSQIECVLLFDIDGTLIDSAGAGGGALLQAAREHFERPELQPVPLHGRTDRGIMSEMLENVGIPADQHNLRQLSDRYLSILPNELKLREGRVLPGVFELLDRLVSDPRMHLGIVTGNMPESARIKLEHFELWHYFKFGVYGHEAVKRRDLSEPAWSSIRQHAGHLTPERIVIIGDTELDVDLALTMNVRCLAVCTGGCDAESLQSAGAHRVERDLADTEEILRWFHPPLSRAD